MFHLQMFISAKYLPSIEGYSGLGCILFQLVEGACSERVCTNETCLPSFPGVVGGQLCEKETSMCGERK